MSRPRDIDIVIDGIEITVHGVTPPTRPSLYDPGDPWEWSHCEVTGIPEGYEDDHEGLTRAELIDLVERTLDEDEVREAVAACWGGEQ